jgi:hypothetical protein
VKTITLFTVAAILLMHLFGSRSGVGSPTTDILVSFAIMLAVGIYEAWGRGLVGWLVYSVLAVVGGVVALCLTSLALEATVAALHTQGRFATLTQPLRRIADVVMPLAAVLGAWLPLKLINSDKRLMKKRGNEPRADIDSNG